jgi:hypothetical protein
VLHFGVRILATIVIYDFRKFSLTVIGINLILYILRNNYGISLLLILSGSSASEPGPSSAASTEYIQKSAYLFRSAEVEPQNTHFHLKCRLLDDS